MRSPTFEVPAVDRRAVGHVVSTGLVRVAVMVSWAVIYFAVALAAMAGLIKVATGWDVVMLDSGSMSPTLRAGDVLFLDDVPDSAIGQQAVITFERDDGDLVTHRVFETLAADLTYVTKGDANPEPDSDLVAQADVVGVGTLVIPYLGLPLLWMASGDLVTLGLLSTVVLAALLTAAFSVLRSPPGSTDDDDGRSASSSAQRGIGRVRLVVAVMIGAVAVIDGGQLGFSAVGWSDTVTVAVVLGGLAVATLIGMLRRDTTSLRTSRQLALLELGADTAVVVLFVAATGTSGVGWTLMALPIIEAAIHFRLTGAFLHWILLSAVSSGALLWTNRVTGVPQSIAISSLEQLVDRLGVLLLVVIPGSYLAEQLLGDVVDQRRATNRAKERSARIEKVTASGRELARLDSDLFPTLAEAAIGLGFEVADCWTGHPDDGWAPLASISDGVVLPAPDQPGGAMRHRDLAFDEAFVDVDDPDADAAGDLVAAGLATLVRITLLHRDSMYVVLRCGTSEVVDDPTSQAMGVRLLAGQAVVALQNEQLMRELRTSHDAIEHQAHHDSLTGLPNRSRFVGDLEAALAGRGADASALSVMFLDLNGFKAINDRLGHHAGDQLLKDFAEILRSCAEGSGTVARLGGDEFTVLLDGHLPGEESGLAARIHDRLTATLEIGNETTRVSTSIGIASATPDVAPGELLRRADVAMYAAKSRGADGTQIYSEELDQSERRGRTLTDDLAAAIGAPDGLELEYQPIVSTVDDEIVGIEALVRWTHPALGSVPPPEIIETAEIAGCVDRLHRWIMLTALCETASLDDVHTRELFIAVNVSPNELLLPTLGDNISNALDVSGLDSSRVVVELSERIVANSHESDECIAALLRCDVRLALDDFGEGQTSLAHLRNWPISYLKLDRSFILHSAESDVDRKILRSVIELSHDLGFSVIAEGIENIEQHTVVTKVGADLLQGFGLFRPMGLDRLRTVLSSPREIPEPWMIDATPSLGFDPPTDAMSRGPGHFVPEAVNHAP